MKYYIIKLIDPGSSKITVVRAIKDTTYLGLKSAKYVVDNAPVRVMATANRTVARNLAKALREANAEITSTITNYT